MTQRVDPLPPMLTHRRLVPKTPAQGCQMPSSFLLASLPMLVQQTHDMLKPAQFRDQSELTEVQIRKIQFGFVGSEIPFDQCWGCPMAFSNRGWLFSGDRSLSPFFRQLVPTRPKSLCLHSVSLSHFGHVTKDRRGPGFCKLSHFLPRWPCREAPPRTPEGLLGTLGLLSTVTARSLTVTIDVGVLVSRHLSCERREPRAQRKEVQAATSTSRFKEGGFGIVCRHHRRPRDSPERFCNYLLKSFVPVPCNDPETPSEFLCEFHQLSPELLIARASVLLDVPVQECRRAWACTRRRPWRPATFHPTILIRASGA